MQTITGIHHITAIAGDPQRNTDHARRDGAWTGSAVSADAAICGFHSATVSEEGYEKTADLLQRVMGLRLIGNEGNRLMLPPQVEPHRSTIERALPRLTLPHQRSEVGDDSHR